MSSVTGRLGSSTTAVPELVGAQAQPVLRGEGGEEADRVAGEGLVARGQDVVPGAGDDPLAGRPSAAALAGRGVAVLDETVEGELVEVPAHAGRGEAEIGGETSRGDRSSLAHGREDAVAGTRVALGRAEVVRLGRASRINHTPMLRKSGERHKGR